MTTHSSEASGTHHSLHSLPGRNSDNATALKLPAFPTTLSHHHTMTTPPSPTDDGTFPRSLVYWAILLSSTLTSGTAFGWPSLKLILEDEGVMRDACPGSNATFTADCTARQLNFTTIYMGGFFSLLASRLVFGIALDYVGPRWSSCVGIIMVLAGAVCLALGDSLGPLFAGFALIGFGGPGLHVSAFHVSNLFPAQKRRGVISSFSGAFGLSGVLFVPFRLLYVGGVTRAAIFIGWAVAVAVIFVVVFLSQPMRSFRPGQIVRRRRLLVVDGGGGDGGSDGGSGSGKGGQVNPSAQVTASTSSASSTPATTSAPSFLSSPPGTDDTLTNDDTDGPTKCTLLVINASTGTGHEEQEIGEQVGGDEQRNNDPAGGVVASSREHHGDAGSDKQRRGGGTGTYQSPMQRMGIGRMGKFTTPSSNSGTSTPPAATGLVKDEGLFPADLRDRQLWPQVKTFEAVGVTMFLSLSFLNMTFYVSNSREILNLLGDGATGNTFVVVFNMLSAFGIVFTPLTARLLSRMGLVFTMYVVVGSSILYGVLTFVPSLEAQVLTFMVWSFARFTLWAAYFSFLPAAFGFRTFGRINGIISVASAVVNLLNYPLTALSLSLGSFAPVIGGLTVVQALLAVFPVCLHVRRGRRRRRQAAKAAANEDVSGVVA